MLMAACSVLEPMAENEAPPADSATSRAASGRERSPRAPAGVEPTRLPAQTGLESATPAPGTGYRPGVGRPRSATGQTHARTRPRAQADAAPVPAAAAGPPAATQVAPRGEPPAPGAAGGRPPVQGGVPHQSVASAGNTDAKADIEAGAEGENDPDVDAGIDADVEAALAQTEPLHPTANRPYRIANRRYQPMTTRKPFRQRGMASWYGKPFHGRKTAIGERFDMAGMTAAHPTLPLPSWVRVTNARTGASVVVRVNDRGPFAGDRIIDLSHAAADRLDFLDEGLVAVEVELLLPDDGAQTDSAD